MRFLPLLLILATRPAGAFFFDAGAKETFGTQRYSNLNIFADFGGDWHFKPSFSTYHSDFSSGTFNTLSLRAAYDAKLWGVGFSAGGTPKVNGYSNDFFGVDGVVSLSPTGSGPLKRIHAADEGEGQATGKGLARLDLGGGLTHTSHFDDFQAGGVRRAAGGTVTIGQTDLNAFAGASVLSNLVSLDVTKSLYDKNLTAINARRSPVLHASGLFSVLSGFASTNTTVRLENSFFPLVTPFVSYTHTTYELNLPVSNAVAFGASADFDMAAASASYQRVTQSGQTTLNLASLGATVRF